MCLDWEIPASTKAGMVPVLGQHMLLSTLPTACWAQCCCLHFSSPSYEVRGTYFEAVSCLRFCGQQMHSPAGRIWFWSYFSMNLPAVSLRWGEGGGREAFPTLIAFLLKLQQKQSFKNPFHTLLSRHQNVPWRTSQLFKSRSGPGGIPLLHHHSGPSICFPPFILFSGLSYRALTLFGKVPQLSEE